MVLLGMADEISAHFIDCGMVSCSVSLWAVLGTKVLARWASIGSTSCGDDNSWPAASLSLMCCNLVSLTSGVSTANLSCWLAVIRCNLVSLSSGVSAAVLLCSGYFSTVK